MRMGESLTAWGKLGWLVPGSEAGGIHSLHGYCKLLRQEKFSQEQLSMEVLFANYSTRRTDLRRHSRPIVATTRIKLYDLATVIVTYWRSFTADAPLDASSRLIGLYMSLGWFQRRYDRQSWHREAKCEKMQNSGKMDREKRSKLENIRMGTAHDAFSFPVSRYNILSFKKNYI